MQTNYVGYRNTPGIMIMLIQNNNNNNNNNNNKDDIYNAVIMTTKSLREFAQFI